MTDLYADRVREPDKIYFGFVFSWYIGRACSSFFLQLIV